MKEITRTKYTKTIDNCLSLWKIAFKLSSTHVARSQNEKKEEEENIKNKKSFVYRLKIEVIFRVLLVNISYEICMKMYVDVEYLLRLTRSISILIRC